jgi:hypothetical protein
MIPNDDHHPERPEQEAEDAARRLLPATLLAQAVATLRNGVVMISFVRRFSPSRGLRLPEAVAERPQPRGDRVARTAMSR